MRKQPFFFHESIRPNGYSIDPNLLWKKDREYAINSYVISFIYSEHLLMFLVYFF